MFGTVNGPTQWITTYVTIGVVITVVGGGIAGVEAAWTAARTKQSPTWLGRLFLLFRYLPRCESEDEDAPDCTQGVMLTQDLQEGRYYVPPSFDSDLIIELTHGGASTLPVNIRLSKLALEESFEWESGIE